ncbi:MAG: cupin domain-containing protein [Thermomicrobiales bacterium]
MLTASLNNLSLMELQSPEDETLDIRVDFPIFAAKGSADSATVYFELEPGKRLGRHTDSQEEILYIIDGKGDLEVAGEWGRVSGGDLAVVPGQQPHQIRNTGGSTLKVLGFFAGASVVSIFETSPIPGTDKTVFVTGPSGQEILNASVLMPAQ